MKKSLATSLCPFRIGRALLEDNLDLCTSNDVKHIMGALRARDVIKLASYTSENRLRSPSHCLLFDQMNALFKKNASFVSKDANNIAWVQFQKNETRCRITSRRLDYYLFVRPDRAPEDIFKVLCRASRIVERWMGSHRQFLDKLPEFVRTTGGATSTKPRSATSAVQKISLRQPVPEPCVPLMRAIGKWYNKDIRPTVCNFNRIAFVPKNYKTARTIACEPQGVLPLQLACDALIKQRLSRIGVNLSDQTRNQALSKHASIMGDVVTLDLANASDSLTIPVMEFLLPKAFFELFMTLRSPFYKSEFGNGVYSKYASMGNGLTFPIETLVFAAVVAACGGDLRGDSSIYGDDIIVPANISDLVCRVLSFIGFRLNHEKSFVSGPFRESCGENWYHGTRVTPFFMRDSVTNQADACLVINSLCEIFPTGQRLAALFKCCVDDHKLPLGPVSQNLRDSVHVSVYTAYSRQMISFHNGILYVRRLVERMSPKTRKEIFRAGGSIGYYYWLITRNRTDCAADDYVGYHEGFSTPRDKSDDINLRYRLSKTPWHIALGQFNRVNSLLDLLICG